jgi:hypothetical protein
MARGLVTLLVLVAAALGGCDKSGASAADAGDASARDAGSEASAQNGDGGPLMDESAMPASGGEELSARMKHLLEAIAQNNPDLASDVVFPREGYTQARDATDPAKLWEKRVQAAFKRNVERTHKRTKGIENAKFVSFELGKSVVQMSPKKKDFKKPLWRVKHSKLTYSVDGKTHHITIAEMTAWRGNWYVTRLR